MKKKYVFIYFFLIFTLSLTGCSNNVISGSTSNKSSSTTTVSSKSSSENKLINYTGESANWKGVYTTKNNTSSRQGVFIFTYKKGGNVVFKNLQIVIKSPVSSHITVKLDDYKGPSFRLNNGPNGDNFNGSDTINVEINWNNKNKETFLLKKN